MVSFLNTVEFNFDTVKFKFVNINTAIAVLYIQADVPTTTRLIFVFTVIGSFMHIVFFTYSCHGLIEESTKICFATYSGWWTTLPMTEAGKMIRKDVNIMMMKSIRPCCLSAGGFFPVSLETSTAVRNLIRKFQIFQSQ